MVAPIPQQNLQIQAQEIKYNGTEWSQANCKSGTLDSLLPEVLLVWSGSSNNIIQRCKNISLGPIHKKKVKRFNWLYVTEVYSTGDCKYCQLYFYEWSLAGVGGLGFES